MIAQGEVAAAAQLAQLTPTLIFGVVMVVTNIAVLRIMQRSCREDKAELVQRFDTALKVAQTLADEITRERERD